MQYQAKDLFNLQTELVEAKVDMAVSHAIDRVVEQISGLRNEMNMRFSSLDNRMVAVETKLGIVNETQSEIRSQVNQTESVIRTKFIDYAFKAGWLILAAIGTGAFYGVIYTHFFLR